MYYTLRSTGLDLVHVQDTPQTMPCTMSCAHLAPCLLALPVMIRELNVAP